jgi:hypothetical protein
MTYRRRRQHLLVIALHTGLAVFTYAFILSTLRRAREPHVLKMACDRSAFRVRHVYTVNAGVLHDTTKRVPAMELRDVPTLAFDESVNEVECLFGGRRSSREVVGQDADQLPSATLRQASSHCATLSTSLTIYYPHHSYSLSDTTYRKAMQ